jgi:hypothetical protein
MEKITRVCEHGDLQQYCDKCKNEKVKKEMAEARLKLSELDDIKFQLYELKNKYELLKLYHNDAIEEIKNNRCPLCCCTGKCKENV